MLFFLHIGEYLATYTEHIGPIGPVLYYDKNVGGGLAKQTFFARTQNRERLFRRRLLFVHVVSLSNNVTWKADGSSSKHAHCREIQSQTLERLCLPPGSTKMKINRGEFERPTRTLTSAVEHPSLIKTGAFPALTLTRRSARLVEPGGYSVGREQMVQVNRTLVSLL